MISTKKENIEKLNKYSSDVSVRKIDEISAFRGIVYGAEIVISTVSSELQDMMQFFGYNLRKAERVMLLWPPSYTADSEIRCHSGKIFLSSTFNLRPRSNISCRYEQLSYSGELYAIDVSDSLRISLTNATLLISSEETEIPIMNCEPRIEFTTIVEVGEDNAFYSVGKDGYHLLPPGQYHLTEGISIFRCEGNYNTVVYLLPELQEDSPIKKLMDIRKYYHVMKPFSDDLITGVHLSKVAEIYVEDCRNTGMINVKALEYIKAGMI